MANLFNFCGKIALGKETEKFRPIEVKKFTSGWMSTNVKFNCISGTNRVLCVSQGGKWDDDKKNSVKTFSKSTTDENGNVTKGESITIPWDKRFDKDQVEKVAGFRKFVCDTGDASIRYKLQNLVEAFENGTVTDDMMEEMNIDNFEDAKVALEKSLSKKKEFISEWDFSEHLIKVCKSDKMKDKKFYISGTYDIQYNPVNGKFYTNYHVSRVKLAPSDAEPSTEMKIDFFYGEDAWDDSQYDETGKCFVNGWVSYYDGNKDIKSTGFKPTTIVIKEDNEKKLKGLKERKFNVDEGIKQIGLTLQVVEGAERVEITMDMLDDETREDIECGLLDFEEVKKSLGGNTYGDRVSELRFEELTESKNIPQETTYAVEDMRPARKKEEKVVIEEKVIDDDLPFDLDDDL